MLFRRRTSQMNMCWINLQKPSRRCFGFGKPWSVSSQKTQMAPSKRLSKMSCRFQCYICVFWRALFQKEPVECAAYHINIGSFTNSPWHTILLFSTCPYLLPRSHWHILSLYEPGSKLLVLGMVIQPLIGNPYNEYINPYYWVDEFIPSPIIWK